MSWLQSVAPKSNSYLDHPSCLHCVSSDIFCSLNTSVGFHMHCFGGEAGTWHCCHPPWLQSSRTPSLCPRQSQGWAGVWLLSWVSALGEGRRHPQQCTSANPFVTGAFGSIFKGQFLLCYRQGSRLRTLRLLLCRPQGTKVSGQKAPPGFVKRGQSSWTSVTRKGWRPLHWGIAGEEDFLLLFKKSTPFLMQSV